MEECIDCVSVVDISQAVPLNLARPVYGYVVPLFVAINATTNVFVVFVLRHKHLRTPTNFVLCAMAITDLFTGVVTLPWFVYYYTLEGYKTDALHGLPPTWCRVYPYLSHALPTIFHTSCIWLTVYLAITRYVYCATLTELFNLLGKYTESLELDQRRLCIIKFRPFVLHWVGVEWFYSLHYWARAIMVHIVPCILLTIFTFKLARTLKRTELRKRSWYISADNCEPDTLDARPTPANSSSSSRRSLYATNRMLAAICGVFLLVEIPAALIFIAHYFIASRVGQHFPAAYHVLNLALIIRNLLIVLTSPVQFGVYCSMSEQFRLTARQLFSSRLLFVAQAQATFHGGKRYSLILVDVALVGRGSSLRSRRSVRVLRGGRGVWASCRRPQPPHEHMSASGEWPPNGGGGFITATPVRVAALLLGSGEYERGGVRPQVRAPSANPGHPAMTAPGSRVPRIKPADALADP